MDVPSDLIVTVSDVRRAGYCARGMKPWFDAYGLNFRDFLKNGISAAEALATGDALAERVIAKKLDR